MSRFIHLFKLPTFFVFLYLLPATTFSQDTIDTLKHWKAGSIISLNFSQVYFNDYWAAGGENSMAALGNYSGFANFKRKNTTWENKLELNYGITKVEDKEARKSDDKLFFSSQLGIKESEHWLYSAFVSFESQFDAGYKYFGDTAKSKISDFMSPAYLIASLGMDYKYDDVFTLFLSPVTEKTTFVMNDDLAAAGAFGVDEGKNARYEIGGSLIASFKREILENVLLQTKLNLFSNYLDNPENIDVNFEMKLDMKINQWLSANFILNAVYDDDVRVGNDGPKTQLKQVFGLAINYKMGM